MGWTKDNGNVAKRNAEYAKVQGERVENVIEDVQEAITVAEQATQGANDATRLAQTQANYIAARQPMIEKAITDSGTAKQDASTAKTKAESVESQFNRVVAEAGSNNPEVVQARGGEVNLNARLDKFTAQLSDTARQTSVLSQGVSVVNANNTALADAEIEGRTLVNLLGRLGRTATSATVTVEPTKYYVFVKHNQTTKSVTFTKYTGQSTLTLTWASGEYAALYEVELANYPKIGVEWDSVAVGNRYPYVDDVKHIQGVAITAEGENLLPPFTDGRWNLASSPVIESAYKISTSNGSVNTINIPVSQLQQYSFGISKQLGVVLFWMFDANGTKIGPDYGFISSATNGNVTTTFTVPANAIRVEVRIYGTGATFENPILTLGSTPKPFVPRNPSSLYADVKLGAIGNQKDTLFKRDERWLLRKAIEKDVVLDGSLNWSFSFDYSGYKRFLVSDFLLNNQIDVPSVLTNYKGNILKQIPSIAITTTADVFVLGGNNRILYVTLFDIETGFPEQYTPNSNDIKRYFNGWKYVDGTTWTSVTGNGQMATAQQALDTKPTDYTPYKLSYVLTTPQTIDVTDKIEGQLKLNGLTQVSVDAGYRRTVIDGKSTWIKGSTFDYTANPTAVKLTYANNIRNALDDTTRVVQDNATMLSVHEKAIVDLYVRVKALGGI